MKNTLFLALRSLRWYRGRATTIVLCLTLTLWLPLTVRLLLNQFRTEIVSRAKSTPLVIGAKGSRIDLALNALYFDTLPPDELTMSESHYIQDSGFATAMPLHVRYRTQSVNQVDGVPIVGTVLEYFEFRDMRIVRGHGLRMLGDCVLGSDVAESMNLEPGDQILSAPKNAFNLAGDYPLKMTIRGVLAPTHSPDDGVVFCDIRTAWIIDGIGHGHQDLSTESVEEGVLLEKEDGQVTASAAVLPYTEITSENVGSFHFHGHEADWPVTAIIANPDSRKHQTLLLGRYASDRKEKAQCVRPFRVVDDLMSIVFRVERLVQLSSLLSVCVTGLLLGLVILLSIRLRGPEIRTMHKLGCSRGTVVSLVGTEILLMTLCGTLLALAAAWGCSVAASDGLRTLLF